MKCPHCHKTITARTIAKHLGSRKSPAKAKASAENGKLGGRPKKATTAQQPNNSAAQGYLWLSQVQSAWQLTAMNGCSGSEDVDAALTPQGVAGETAIEDDLYARYLP